MNGRKQKINPLPKSNEDYWDGAESYTSEPVEIPICKTHSPKKWMKHKGYIDNGDGTVSCKFCPWGFRLPGYARIYKGKVYDLRTSKT